MGGADFGNMERDSGITTVEHALEIARDTPEGTQDPSVVDVLENAIADIWRKVQAKPTSYVMSRGEFAVFNYFQSRFLGNELATSAKKRFWDSNGS